MECSIIVPTYNEEKRLPYFLPNLLTFSATLKSCEIILVNDGSTDNTLITLQKLTKHSVAKTRIISYEKNKGKGWAIKKGIEAAHGKNILFIDADGSINPDQIPHMLEKLTTFDVVAGDRSSLQSTVDQPLSRHITGKLFNLYVDLLFQSTIRDNLCGFKGFQQDVAQTLFSNLQSPRWLFDVELFYKIKKREYTLYRLPLVWKHTEESKITLSDPFKMAFQLLALRYKLFFWHPPNTKDSRNSAPV